uniref:Uncharacterized protein n=1 Tax=Chelydra serpentina TaxID=8475 RepID=A0A8C3S4K4_CHESE
MGLFLQGCISVQIDSVLVPTTVHPRAVSSTGHPIDIAHSGLDLLSESPTAASQAAGITGTCHHTSTVQLVVLTNILNSTQSARAIHFGQNKLALFSLYIA